MTGSPAGHRILERMNLGPHVAVSAAAGAVLWAATGDVKTLPVAIGAGVLPDVDHLLDYYNWYVRRSYSRLILLLHGWEYLAAAGLIYFFVLREDWMLAVVIGYATVQRCPLAHLLALC